jgi:hypothetical protein
MPCRVTRGRVIDHYALLAVCRCRSTDTYARFAFARPIGTAFLKAADYPGVRLMTSACTAFEAKGPLRVTKYKKKAAVEAAAFDSR